MMNLENFVVPESKEVFQETWGCVRVFFFFFFILCGFLYPCKDNC